MYLGELKVKDLISLNALNHLTDVETELCINASTDIVAFAACTCTAEFMCVLFISS